MNSWKAFLLAAGCRSIFPEKKIIEMLEEVVFSWQEVRCIWQISDNILAQFVQLWKNWLYDVQPGVSVENWAISRDLCWPQVLQVSLHLINLLSILLRCNGFIGIQKAVVDETGSRLPNSDHDLFWFKFDFGKCFGASSQSNHQPSHHQLYNIHSSLHITIRLRNGSLLLHRKRDETSKRLFFFFWFVVGSWGSPGGPDSKESTCNAGDQVQSLGWEDSLEEEMETHSNILAWRILSTEEPGRLQSRVTKSWTWLSS